MLGALKQGNGFNGDLCLVFWLTSVFLLLDPSLQMAA